ncbi:MAG: hypothetical protein ACYSSP_04270 [Planctomycetota bacterium]|jgi:hypothetical protein
MKKMCKNCEFFVPSSSPLIGDEWGECIKPGLEIKQFNGQIQGDFTWADSLCSDFSARKNKKYGLLRK